MKNDNKLALIKLTQFKGVYLSGFYIRNPATVTALSLLFEKVHLPNQLELIIEFSKRHIIDPENKLSDVRIEFESIGNDNSILDPLASLDKIQRLTAEKYLFLSHSFCIRHHELFPTVFTTDMLKKSKVFDVKLVKKGKPGEKNTYNVTTAPQLVNLEGMNLIKSKLDNGYVPIVGQENLIYNKEILTSSNKSIAAILAMKSIEMMLPSFTSAKPQDILEARDKLKDFLPPFWSAMLKLSKDTKKIIEVSSTSKEAINECQNIVDTIVRPALVELVTKMEKERKNWFYRIISPVANTLRLVISNPPIDQATLIKTSLALATDVSAEYMVSRQKIEDLKSDSGLTFLLEVHKNL